MNTALHPTQHTHAEERPYLCTSVDEDVAVSLWGAVVCLSLLCFVLVASEFMPVSLLTPIAEGLSITEGQAGQAIAVSGLFAVATSLFGNALLTKLDRKTAVALYTVIMIASGLAVTFSPNQSVFMMGRALIGISIGGFWSLSTAIVVRIVAKADIPKAIAMLQGGNALALVVAAPIGSFLGGLIGWRGAFFSIVPIGVAGLVWQLVALPRLPANRGASITRMLGLLNSRIFATGMAATIFAFMGEFSLATYLRPFLEQVTGLDVKMLSLYLFGLGAVGVVGTVATSYILRASLASALIGLPIALCMVSLLLIVVGHLAFPTAVLILLWGLFTTPIPVSWNTWMARLIPDDLEAGGALQVALIQFAITLGAFVGGVLFDGFGWASTFAFSAVLFLLGALTAMFATRHLRGGWR